MKKVFGVFLYLIVLMSLSACEAERPDDSRKPNPEELLCLTFVSSGESTIALIKKGEPFEITLEYSVDGGVWKSYSIGKTVILADGEELMFRAGADGNAFFSSSDGYYNFKITGSVAARGNIMSLLNRKCGRNSVPSCAFLGLFANCRSLTSAPVLPSTNLALSCYEQMFYGCTSLTEAPDLPATELAKGCYCNMFWGCTSLTKVPELPARELAAMCYLGMFNGCTSLTGAPSLSAMVLAYGCYSSMFSRCTNLTKAPTLPAMKLAEECYSWMFDGCTSLNYVKALFTDGPSEETTYSWLRCVSPTGTFVKSKNATWDVRGEGGIPEGWTVVTE